MDKRKESCAKQEKKGKVIPELQITIRLAFKLLEGKNVNLRAMEVEDLPLVLEWFNDPEFLGEYNPLRQISRTEKEKTLENGKPSEQKSFIIEKKDGVRIGVINHFNVIWDGVGKLLTIAYCLLPVERGKGYCTEAARIMVDYLFLKMDIPCIQATTHIKNVASQRVLEKVGFRKEGVMRKRFFIQGSWQDQVVFSILREEWEKPKILV